MKTRTIISNIILASSMVVGSAQAGSMTTDEVFQLITSGDSNYIEAGETVEFARMEFSDVDSSHEVGRKQSVYEVFELITSGDSNSIESDESVEFAKLELSDVDRGNEASRKQSIHELFDFLSTD